jgi:HD superfamily phosphohydrolase
MLDLKNDRLVVEAKGIYSIENFLTSRRLMYWQVYLHKTAVAAERMLMKVLARAKEVTNMGIKLFASPALRYFLENKIDKDFYEQNTEAVLSQFVRLDDNDIWCALKVWADSGDVVLSKLSSGLVNRKLFKIEVTGESASPAHIRKYTEHYMKDLNINEYEASYLYSSDVIYTNMYNEDDDSIDILYNDGTIKDISVASDMLNIQLLSKTVEKYYFSYLKL